ncbi:MAG TPA: glycosyltransferase, partial [Thermoplasmata archaeon]|nr:glycosyltransferase [Thermoplasmata archaeon]
MLSLAIFPLILDFFRLIGAVVVGAALLVAASPVPVGVVFVAATLGYSLFRWWVAITRRLKQGARLRPIRLPNPSPLSRPTPPAWIEDSGPEPGRGPQVTAFPSVATVSAPRAAVPPHVTATFRMGVTPDHSGPAPVSNGPMGPPPVPNGGTVAPPPPWKEVEMEDPPRPVAPSRPPPPPAHFGWKLTGFFALFAGLLLYFSAYLFDGYNRAVALLGTVVYWPLPWPGGGTLLQPLVTPDFIFLMYLSLFLAYGAAYLVSRKERLRPTQRRAALLTVTSYVFFAILLDVFIESGSVHPFLTSFSLVARMLMGGLFLAVLQFSTLVVPGPLFVDARLKRRRGSIAVMFSAAGAAVAAALVLLYAAWLFLGIGRDLVPFAVLLLLPIYSYLFWTLIGRVLYWSEVRSRPVPTVREFHPAVSFIIPAYQEEEGIAEAIRCADAAAGQYPGAVEILVGNDGSTDRTSAIAHAEIGALRHATGRVLDLPHGGKSNALNGMLRAA